MLMSLKIRHESRLRHRALVPNRPETFIPGIHSSFFLHHSTFKRPSLPPDPLTPRLRATPRANPTRPSQKQLPSSQPAARRLRTVEESVSLHKQELLPVEQRKNEVLGACVFEAGFLGVGRLAGQEREVDAFHAVWLVVKSEHEGV